MMNYCWKTLSSKSSNALLNKASTVTCYSILTQLFQIFNWIFVQLLLVQNICSGSCMNVSTIKYISENSLKLHEPLGECNLKEFSKLRTRAG